MPREDFEPRIEESESVSLIIRPTGQCLPLKITRFFAAFYLIPAPLYDDKAERYGGTRHRVLARQAPVQEDDRQAKEHMLRIRIFMIGLVGFIPTPALAADWVSLGPDDEMEVFYDRSSITGNGDIRKVWMNMYRKWVPKSHPAINRPRRIFMFGQAMREISITYYKADGAVEESQNTPDAPFTDIIP